jgi:Na+/melibiose symporter-like transporter
MSQRIPLLTLVAFGLPALPAAAFGLPLLLYLPAFYAVDLGLGFTVVGAVILAARLLDVAVDPLIGWASDRVHTPYGRRRPWLIASLPPVLLAAAFLFRPEAPVSAGGFLFWAFAGYLGWSLMTIPHQAWGAELSGDYAERNRVMAAREIFGLLGVVLAAAIPTLLAVLALDDPKRSEAGDALSALAWLVTLLLPLSGLLLVAVVPEPARVAGAVASAGWRAGSKLLSGNRPFRLLLVSYLFNGIANGLPATLIVLYVTHVLRLEAYLGVFLIAYFAAGILGMPLWLKLARRHGKHRTWGLAMIFTCAAFALVPLLGPGDFHGYLAVCLATGLAFGADLTLPASMQADVVDVDTEAGGDQRTGLYFALWAMATKLALALAVGIAFPLLDLLGVQVDGSSPEATRLGLGMLYAALPVAFKVVAIILMWNFPLDAAAQASLRQRIER